MTALVSRFSIAGDLSIFAGEAPPVELAFQGKDGALIDLTGRVFALTIYRIKDREVLYSAAGDIIVQATDKFVRFAIDGDTTEILYQTERINCRYEIAELTALGREVWIEGKIAIAKSAAVANPGVVAVGDGSVTRFVFDNQTHRLTISSRGDPGRSASDQLFVAGIIPEPTTPAMAAWQRKPAEDAARLAGQNVAAAITELGEFTSQRSADIDAAIDQADTDVTAFRTAARADVDAKIGEAEAARVATVAATGRANTATKNAQDQADRIGDISAAVSTTTMNRAASEIARDGAQAAVTSLKRAVPQRIGRPVDPVSSAGGVAAAVLLGDPIANAGPLASLRLYVSATGALTLNRYTRVGTTYTKVASYTANLVATGLAVLTAADFGVPSITFTPGEYVALSINGRWAVTNNTAADGAGWAQIDLSAASATITGFSTAARLEVQLNIDGAIQTVTADTFAALKAQADGTKSSADSAVAVAGQLTKVIGQQVGRPIDPVDGTASNSVILLGDPVTNAGTLTSLKLYAKATGSFTLHRYARAGTTFTKVGSYTATLSATGLTTLTPADFGVTSIPVAAGDCFAIEASGRWTNTGGVGADGSGWAIVDPTKPSVTVTGWTMTPRLELQFNIAGVTQPVTADTFAALKAQADATQAGVAGNSAAAGQLLASFPQQIGRSGDPITGGAASAGAIVLGDPVVNAGTVSSIKLFVMAAGTFTLGRYTKADTTFTRVATYTATIATTGLVTLTPADFGVASMPVAAGEYLVVSAAGRWPTTAGSADGAGWAQASLGTSFTASAWTKTPRLEVQINLAASVQVVTAERFTALKAQADTTKAALDAVGYDPRAMRVLAEIVHFIIYGQSLSLGWGTNALSTSPLAYALRFAGGVRAQDAGTDPAVNYADLRPLIEQNGSFSGESPATGAAQMMAQLLLAENGLDVTAWNRRWLLSAPGNGGTQLTGLSKGSGAYTRLVSDMTYGKSLSGAQGKTFAPQVIFMEQGQQDYPVGTTFAAYQTLFRALQADVQAEARTLVGQADLAVPMIFIQVASHLNYGSAYPLIALAQLGTASDAMIAMAAPEYFFPYNPDNRPHLTAIGYKWMGAYYGLAYKRWLVDGVKPVAMVPTSIKRFGGSLVAKFPVAKGLKLAIDTTIVPAQPGYGFSLVDAAGNAVAVSNVRLVGAGEIAMDCASAPAAGWKLRYGFTGDAIRGIGNLRDTQGDTLIFDPAGINKPMHNWCAIFEQTLA